MSEYFEANIMELRDWKGRGLKEIYGGFWKVIKSCGEQ
jgi:hypothetical protein